MPAPITFDLPVESVKMRWLEPYVTAGLNEKTLGQQAKGVFAGFTVVPGVADFSIKLQVDPVLGFSGANVLDVTSRRYCITIIQTAEVELDLTTWASLDAYVTLEAQYQIGAPSFARLKVVDAAELGSNVNLVLLAKVAVPGAGVVPSGNINMGYRLSAGDSVTREASLPVDLISNGTFERDLAATTPRGWYNYGTPTNPIIDDTVARTGSKSMRLFSAGVATSTIFSDPIPMHAGQTARVSAWIRSSLGSPIALGTGVTVTVRWLNLNQALISTYQIEGNFSGGGETFVQRQALVTAPAGTAYGHVAFLYNSCSGTLYVDDVEFVVRGSEFASLFGEGRSAVFGGSAISADAYHTHTSAGMSYAGGDNWDDGTTNPGPVTVEAQLDKIISDLAGVAPNAGAPKIKNAPSKILTNTFTKTNTFTPDVLDTNAIVATGNGNGAGAIGQGAGATGTSNTAPITGNPAAQAAGLVGYGGSGEGWGVVGKGNGGDGGGVFGIGQSVGVFGTGEGLAPPSGLIGEGVVGYSANGGVLGLGAHPNAYGVKGLGSVNTSNFGSNTVNPPVAGPGTGGVFMGATGDAGGDGLQAWGRGTNNSRTGVLGVGAFPTLAGVAGGSGLYGIGGTGGGGNSNGGYGVIGVAGASTGTGTQGTGVLGTSAGLAFGIGVKGIAGIVGTGVRGETAGSFSTAVWGYVTAGGTSVAAVRGSAADGQQATGVIGEGGGNARGGHFFGGSYGATGVEGTGVGNNPGVVANGGGAFTGSGDFIGGTAPSMTLNDPTGNLFFSGMVGETVTISGATTGANNGTFVISGFTNSSTITYSNGAGVAEAFPGTWSVSGSGFGLRAIGGSPNGHGVRGQGAGSGAGVWGKSSTAFTNPSNSVGVFGEGLIGVEGLSNAAGTGAHGVSGTTATTAAGVYGTNSGTGDGVLGNSSNASGVAVRANASNGGIGVSSYTTATFVPAGRFKNTLAGSVLDLVGLNPAVGMPQSGYKNTVTPLNTCKAWVTMLCNAGSDPTIQDGFNIQSITQAVGGIITVYFSQDMDDGNYLAFPQVYGTFWFEAFSVVDYGDRGTDSCLISTYAIGGAQKTRAEMAGKLVSLIVFGRVA